MKGFYLKKKGLPEIMIHALNFLFLESLFFPLYFSGILADWEISKNGLFLSKLKKKISSWKIRRIKTSLNFFSLQKEFLKNEMNNFLFFFVA